MFPQFKKPPQTEDGDSPIWVAEPTRRDLPLVRRWGVLTNTDVSDRQFNVYHGATAFLVTMHSRDGKELERDAIFHGGACRSIAAAWESVAAYISAVVTCSAMAGLPCQKMIVFETTPDHKPFHLATFEYANGPVQETRHFDPDTRQPLASSVSPSRQAELHARRHHNSDLLSKALDAAVYRMTSCPLAAEVLSEFRGQDERFARAKTRYVVFVSWCARRAAIALSRTNSDQSMVLGIMDALIRQQFESLCADDQEILDLVVKAFEAFDQALANEAEPGGAWWIGRAAASFIFGANFDGLVPDPDNLDKWAKRFSLPSQVLLDIQADAKRILAKLR